MGKHQRGAPMPSVLLLVAVVAVVTVDPEGASNASPATRSAPTDSAQVRSATDRDRTAVRALAAHMTEAWNRGDATGFAAAFAEDGELISGDGTRLVGRSEIERYTARLLMKPTQFSASEIAVRFIDRDVALWTAHGGFLRPGETVIAPGQRGIQSLLARRDAGKWRAVLLQRTRIPPSAQTGGSSLPPPT